MQNVRMNVDGYNFYYAIKEKYHLKRVGMGQESLIGLGWCDFRRLGERMIDPYAERITDIKYFTARVEKDYPGFPGEKDRQQDWLKAVRTISGLRVIMGYLGPPRGDPAKSLKPSRKEHYTDVNIAVQILLDALGPTGYHKAILICGDTDLAPAVYAVQRGMVDRGLIPSGRTVDVWSPPGVKTNGLRKYFEEPEHFCPVRTETMAESMLAESLLPYERPRVYACPPGWRLPPDYLRKNVPDRLRPDISIPERSVGASQEGKR